jgi:protein SCO1/2
MRLLLLIFTLMISACGSKEKLPILGPYEQLAGEKRYHPVPDFELIDQYGNPFNQNSVNNKIRVVDFFFTSCPSICPKVQAQMLRIQEKFAPNDQLVFISHSIDPKRDTVEKLRHYAHNLGIDEGSNWYFLTGSKDVIYNLADDYFNIVVEDASAPGGFDHTGRIVLVDIDGYIRSYANGLNPAAVDTLITDLRQLLDEN